jgi:lysophospholipase
MTEFRRRSLPPGGLQSHLIAHDGWPLRMIDWPETDPALGSILFLNGRGDFIEKYAESYWHWLDLGYGLRAFDWRGQGLSGRYDANPLKGDSRGFEELLSDFVQISADFREHHPGPYHAIAHSMGAHLLLRSLTMQNYPLCFEQLVLLAPMLAIGNRLPKPLLSGFARAAIAFGYGGSFAPMQNASAAARISPARKLLLTSDARRFADEGWWVEQNPQLALGGVTNRWLASAMASSAVLIRPGQVETVALPTLILMAERERLVDNSTTIQTAKRMPHAVVETIAGAAHELLREGDPIRDQVLSRIDVFLRQGG